MQFHRKFSEAVSFYNQKPLKKFEFDFFMKSDKFFDYHLECGIDIAFIWDIPELFIWYIDKIIHEKVVLVSQDFLDGTMWTSKIIR